MSTLTLPDLARRTIKVSRVSDADGALCRDCAAWWADPLFVPLDLHIDTMQLPVEWTWRKSQVMHESGTKHRTQLFKWSLCGK